MDAEGHDGSEAFWNEKAKTFPRYEEGDQTYEAGVLRTIRAHGVDFRGRSVLDVGCGSGMYTIHLAKEARQVTAVDVSERMLRILREDAGAQRLDNITYVRSEWLEFPDGTTYDIVFCSMTPAIHDDASRSKLLRHAKGWIVFMGAADFRPSDILSGLLAHYRLEPKTFNDGPEMRRWLDAQGIGYARYPVEGQWAVPKSRDETLTACATMLMPYGLAPDREHLERYIERFRDAQGRYVERTDYRIDLLIWKK